MAAELANRNVGRRARLLSRAGFPAHKTLTEFDRRVVQLPRTLTWEDLEQGTFIADHRNLVLFWRCRAGQVTLGDSVRYGACKTVRFFTVTGLMVRVTEALQAGTLERTFLDLQRSDLMVLDEWGYLPTDREDAQRLFRVVADSYETRSLILTTHWEFFQWGGVFTDDQMTAAMIDRLAHHGHLLMFEGESYRSSATGDSSARYFQEKIRKAANSSRAFRVSWIEGFNDSPIRAEVENYFELALTVLCAPLESHGLFRHFFASFEFTFRTSVNSLMPERGNMPYVRYLDRLLLWM
ncbi:ATP-binding protein [Sulfobacillus thermosulfidooxidans]|uniref:ATP-binding protein n=1 Tax=Sulfobacillus thermosulfidooxidans TaxID=28034 RepID=UPI0002D9C782|nr:ATP-binding protein [Sulfobacillus thermosulfidooxidans]